MVSRDHRLAAVVLAAALAVGAGCTREVARLSLSGPGAAAGTVDLGDGDVVFSVDAEWAPAARGGGLGGLEAYKLSIAAMQGKRLAAVTTCNPLRLASSGWSREASSERVRVVGNRLADCRLTLPRGGPTALKATLAEARKPDIRLHHLDLIVEQ